MHTLPRRSVFAFPFRIGPLLPEACPPAAR